MNLPVPLALGMNPSRHWRCMNLHLCLTYTQLICTLLSVNCAAGVILPCQDLHESPSTTGPLV
jgi:hypothetical protein